MPLNDYPTAKPTYDFYDTVNAGKTTIANGDLVSTTQNAPDANFLAGSATYHWHWSATIASHRAGAPCRGAHACTGRSPGLIADTVRPAPRATKSGPRGWPPGGIADS
jgi:hypothetical protein